MFALTVLASHAPMPHHAAGGLLLPILVLVLSAPPLRSWRLARPVVSRLLLAVLVAGTLAAGLAASTRPQPAVVIVDECAGYTYTDWQYWALGCELRRIYPF